MWIFRVNNSNLKYEVGYYTPYKDWVCLFVFSSINDAMNKVHFLNGGK